MLGFNGGLIGKTNTTSASSSVPGLWTAREQLEATRNQSWPTSGDLYYNNVSLLLHGDGPGSTDFTDDSPRPKVFTNFGNVISTTEKKFGTGSIRTDNSWMTAPMDDDFELGAGDFTIECWYKGISASNYGSIVSKSFDGPAITSAYALHFRETNTTIGLYLGIFNGNVVNSTTSIRNANDWFHIAVTKEANSTRIFINGTQEGSYAGSYTIPTSSGGTLKVGRDGYSNNFRVNGYIDELRITKGVARYTTDFPVPTAPFPNFYQ